MIKTLLMFIFLVTGSLYALANSADNLTILEKKVNLDIAQVTASKKQLAKQVMNFSAKQGIKNEWDNTLIHMKFVVKDWKAQKREIEQRALTY